MFGTMRRKGLAAIALLGMSASPAGHAEPYASITLATDYLFRGVSQTLSGAALQGELGLEDDRGWYGCLWASNVRFVDGAAPDDGARVELNVGGGREFDLTERLSAGLGVTAYVFPGTVPGVDYDYVEWHGTLTLDGRHEANFGFSPDVFGSGEPGRYYAIATRAELPLRLALSVRLGRYDLDNAFGASYGFTEAAVSKLQGDFDWRLAWVSTHGDADALFPESTIGDRLVLALGISF